MARENYAAILLAIHRRHCRIEGCVPRLFTEDEQTAARAEVVARIVSGEGVRCACGHGNQYHGPEVPGCAECRCRQIPPRDEEATDVG